MHKSVAITDTHDLGNGYSRCALVVLGTRTRKLDAYFFDPSSQFHRRHLRHLLPLADVISSLRASSYSGSRSYRARTSFPTVQRRKGERRAKDNVQNLLLCMSIYRLLFNQSKETRSLSLSMTIICVTTISRLKIH